MTTTEDIQLSSDIFPTYQSQSHCTENYHRVNAFARTLLATDGTIAMANELECYWLLDIVASYMPNIQKLYIKDNRQTFFVARLSKLEGNKALFTLDDGNDNIVITQQIPYTDITMNVKMYLQTDTEHWVLMQPSEY